MDDLEIIGSSDPPHMSKHTMSTVPEEDEPELDEQTPEMRSVMDRYNSN